MECTKAHRLNKLLYVSSACCTQCFCACWVTNYPHVHQGVALCAVGPVVNDVQPLNGSRTAERHIRHARVPCVAEVHRHVVNGKPLGLVDLGQTQEAGTGRDFKQGTSNKSAKNCTSSTVGRAPQVPSPYMRQAVGKYTYQGQVLEALTLQGTFCYLEHAGPTMTHRDCPGQHQWDLRRMTSVQQESCP
jgi:hypothetical protein